MSARRASIRTVLYLVALVLVAGILAMHGLGSIGVSHRMAQTATAPAVTVERHEMSASALDAHGHALAGCVWVLVAGLALLAAARFSRAVYDMRRERSRTRSVFRPEPRGPPTAMRLSLVGVLRR